MRARLLMLLLVAACSGAQDDAVRVAVAPGLGFARGLLDTVTKVTITVHDIAGDLDCDAASGKLTGTVPAPITTKDLGTQCAAGVKFCGDLVVPKSETDRAFAAKAAAP